MRFALIGYGSDGQRLAKALVAAGQELVGVADPDGSRAGSAARELGIRSAGPELQGAARALGCDAVAVATPLSDRFAVIRSALEAGRHVLVEGLPAAEPGRILELQALARSQGRVLLAGPPILFSEGARRLRQLCGSAAAGAPAGLLSWRSRRSAARRVRDLLEVVALPDLALFAWIAGSEPSALSARATRSALTGQVDSVSLSLWYPTGWPARLEIADSEAGPHGLAVLSQQRRVVLDDFGGGKQVLWLEGASRDASQRPERSSRGSRREVSFGDPGASLCEAFLSAIRSGIPREFPCLASALQTLRAAEEQIGQRGAGARAA